jgi:xylulokinase
VPLVLGADSSTQSTKVELRDVASGQLVGTGRAPHPPTSPPRSEQDPAAWWRALTEATAAALAEARPAGAVAADVAAIAIAGQQHGMVVLDGAGAVVRPAKLWNDTESASDADGLVAALGGSQPWADACGSVPLAAFTIAKLAWLRRAEPDSFARLATVLLPHDWLTFRLTGRTTTDRGDASGTGYWSPAADAYRFDLLALVDQRADWPAAVPTVLGPCDVAGGLTAAAAADLGLAPDTLVAPGTGDNMAGALGVGLAPDEVAISIGTSGTVFAVSDRPTADGSGAVAGFADATGHHLPLVCTLNATRVTETIAALLGVDLTTLDELALAAPVGADGLVLLPYLDGERTPNRPSATGVLAGLRTDVGRPALARAAFEGVVCGLLDGLDALRAAGGAPTTPARLVVLGGGARSRAYRQIVADLAGQEVTVPHVAEPVATGAAVQAAAVVEGRLPLEVADGWGLGRGAAVAPDAPTARAAEVRRAYAALRG